MSILLSFTLLGWFAEPPLPLPYIATDRNVRALASGDFDRDGRIDLVIPSGQSQKSPVVLRRNDAGEFDSPAIESDGVAPYWIAVGDFDSDAKLDAAQVMNITVPASGYRLGIAKGDGAGGFSNYVTLDTLTGGNAALADLDADGDLDIAIAIPSQSTVRILTNDGAGSFAFGAGVPLTNPRAITLADFDLDGRFDLATNRLSTSMIDLSRNLGALVFATQPYAFSSEAAALVAGDVTGDGLPELAVSYFLNFGLGAAPNLGGFTFGVPLQLMSNDARVGIGIDDVDGDGFGDVLSGGSGFVVVPGSSSGPQAPLEILRDAEIAFAHSDDWNGDGRVDVAFVPQSFARGVALLETAPDGGFESPIRSIVAAPVTFNPAAPELGDFDGDGAPDAIFAEPDGRIVAARNDGTGSFQFLASVATGASASNLPRPVRLGDLDNDGRLDVTYAPPVSTGIPANGTVWVALRTVGGGFAAPVAVATQGAPSAAVITDLDQDGVADFAYGEHVPNLGFQSTVRLIAKRNLRAPSFTQFASFGLVAMGSTVSASSSQTFLVSDDFDSDGFPDLAATNQLNGAFKVLKNAGNGTYTQLLGTTTARSMSLELGDVDADGFRDLVVCVNDVTTGSPDGFAYFRGDGSTLTQVPVNFGSLGIKDPADLALLDLDGDAALELAFTRLGADFGVDVLEKPIAGIWQRRTLLTDGYLTSLAGADLDLDGRDDLVSANGFQHDSISFHRNLEGTHPFTILGSGKPGTPVTPRMLAQGTLEAGSDGAILLRDAKPNTLAVVVVAVQNIPVNVLGGTLVPFPALFTVSFVTDANGSLTLPWTNHSPATPGQSFWLQTLVADSGATHGVAFSNAVKATQP